MEDIGYPMNGNREDFMGGEEATGPPEEARSQIEEADQRRARRLKEELGINPAGVEVILRLRRQMVVLQARTQQLEAQLRIEQERSEVRLARISGLPLGQGSGV
jgi:hypothetical protein